jgi:hypothetical protein
MQGTVAWHQDTLYGSYHPWKNSVFAFLKNNKQLNKKTTPATGEICPGLHLGYVNILSLVDFLDDPNLSYHTSTENILWEENEKNDT